MNEWDWVEKQEEKNKEERSKEYFNIVEGKQQFVLLSHCAPYPQVYEGGKYRPAVQGDSQDKISLKGVCWVLQDGLIKSAKLPYVVVKVIRGLQQDPEWDFKIPFLHTFTLNAEGAGTKEVKYTLTPSPRVIEIPATILTDLAKKPTPEEVVEKIKGKAEGSTTATAQDTREAPIDYPTEEINPDDIPF